MAVVYVKNNVRKEFPDSEVERWREPEVKTTSKNKITAEAEVIPAADQQEKDE